MSLNNKMKRLEFWEFHKKKVILLIIVVIILIGAKFGLFSNRLIASNKSNLLKWFDNTGFVGVFGSVLGAVVGGVFSFYATIYLQKFQSKSKSLIIKKNIIYSPLYDQLLDISDNIKQNPFPYYFSFRDNHTLVNRQPEFTAWNRIQSDTRAIQVPTYLSGELDSFTNSQKIYNEKRSRAGSDIQERINEILMEKYKTTCTLNNYGSDVLQDILIKKQNIFENHFDGVLAPVPNLSVEEINQLEKLILLECNQINSVIDLKNHYQKLENQLKELINSIQTIIGIINKKYEGSSKYI